MHGAQLGLQLALVILRSGCYAVSVDPVHRRHDAVIEWFARGRRETCTRKVRPLHQALVRKLAFLHNSRPGCARSDHQQGGGGVCLSKLAGPQPEQGKIMEAVGLSSTGLVDLATP